MNSPRASIIVRCYNEREHIGRLLYGIFEQRMDDFEVILVDSGSTDGTLEVARQFPIADVVYIAPEKFSFGRALNYGCEAASGTFCVFASAHVYPMRRDWLETLLMKFDDDVALVYGKQRGSDETKFSEKRIFERWFPDQDRDRQKSPFCNNANAAIRRSVWAEYPYDEELTGLEDLDWAKRVKDAGWAISYASDAAIVHVHDESPRQVFNRYRREAIALKNIMREQEFTGFDFLRLFIANTLSDYRMARRRGELRGSVVEIPQFRLMQFWGTYKGFGRSALTDRLYRRFYYPDTEEYPRREECEKGGSDELIVDYSSVPEWGSFDN